MKIYLATPMGGSPFTDSTSLEVLNYWGCTIVDTILKADFIVAHCYKNLLPCIIRFPKKKFLVWTNEPRYDTVFKNKLKLPFGVNSIDIMNVYGEEVFWHNLHFLSSYHFDYIHNLGIGVNQSVAEFTKEKLKNSNKKNKIAAVFTNTLSLNTILIKDKKNIDLSKKRCEYAIAGYKQNLVEIYGNKWPDGFAIDNSGFGFEKQKNWWSEKIEILNHYKFNLCFENTAQPYYVTEKIWHAIVSNCLPIYNSFNSTIYETFPENSFVDSNNFIDHNSLFEYIKNMSDDEYLTRLNICIDTFNTSLEAKRNIYATNTNEIILKIVHRLLHN